MADVVLWAADDLAGTVIKPASPAGKQLELHSTKTEVTLHAGIVYDPLRVGQTYP